MCRALCARCFPKNFTGDSGRIRTHDLLLTSAAVLTSRPPSLPDDDWPARILYSSGFRDMCGLMKFLPYTDVYIALHTRCFLSVCEKNSQAARAGFEPKTSCLQVPNLCQLSWEIIKYFNLRNCFDNKI